jgi:hypothetical protein
MTLKTARALGYQGEPEGLLEPALNLTLCARLHAQNARLPAANGGASQIEDVVCRYNSGKPYANAPTYTKDVYWPNVRKFLGEYRRKLTGAA